MRVPEEAVEGHITLLVLRRNKPQHENTRLFYLMDNQKQDVYSILKATDMQQRVNLIILDLQVSIFYIYCLSIHSY